MIKKKLQYRSIRVKYHRYTQTEKMEIIRIVEDSEIGVKPPLKELNIHSSTFYHWYNAYREHGYDGLAIKEPKRNKFWNKIPDTVKEEIVEIALEKSEFSPKRVSALHCGH